MKIRINQRSLPWLIEIDRYIRECDVRGQFLSHAASDVLDGWIMRPELEELTRRLLIEIVPVDGGTPLRNPALCGNYYTAHLTTRAMRAFWPDRATGASA